MKKIITLLLTVLLFLATLCACVPDSYNKAEDKLSKAGYTVSVDKDSVPALIHVMCNVQNCSYMEASNTENGGFVSAFFFGSKEDAQTASEYIKEWSAKKQNSSGVIVKDEVVYFGNEQGVKDFK